jgi:hypothetical protein
MNPSPKSSGQYSNRLVEFFKRFFSGKKQQEITQDFYHRDYDRFPMEFEVLVTLVDSNDEKHYDRAELHDISGSGAMFLTRMPEKYHLNQSLQLKIFLAGTDDVRGCIKTESCVVRMQRMDRAANGMSPVPLTGIAVKFQKAFEFERVDKNFFGGKQ